MNLVHAGFRRVCSHQCYIVYILISLPQLMPCIGDVSKLLLVLMRLIPIKKIFEIKIVGSFLGLITSLSVQVYWDVPVD